VTTIQTLINKRDNVEVVRDQIGAILALEVQSQMALAALAAENPADWDLKVFLERVNPWGEFSESDTTPVVNVFWEASTFDPSASNVVMRQKTSAIFNVDCYGYGVAAADGTGQIPGDELAAAEAMRTARLVRNILMSANYAYLDMRGVVWKRFVRGINGFQPQQGDLNGVQVMACRLLLEVEFSEFSPQYDGVELENVLIEFERSSDNQVIIQAEYDYTP